MERPGRRKINICRVDENSLSFQAGCLEEFGCFSSLLFSTLPALYLLPESLIHCAYSKALYHTDRKQRQLSGGESHVIGNMASTMWFCTYFILCAVTFSIVPH